MAAIIPFLHILKKGTAIPVYVGCQNREVRLPGIGQERLCSKVKLMVAGCHQIVSGLVHQFNYIRPFCQGSQGKPLSCIAGVYQYRIRGTFLQPCRQINAHNVFPVTAEIAMRIVCVIDDHFLHGSTVLAAV